MPCDQHVHAANSGVHAFHYLQPLVGVVPVKWLLAMDHLNTGTWSMWHNHVNLRVDNDCFNASLSSQSANNGFRDLKGPAVKKKKKKKLQCFLAFCEGAFEMWQTLLAYYDEIQSLDGPSLKNAAFMSWGLDGWDEKDSYAYKLWALVLRVNYWILIQLSQAGSW